MEISTSLNIVTIKGNIKSVSNFQEIKNCVDDLIRHQSSITIIISDSLSITSSIIGYFNKLILKDKINLSMEVGNEQLFELLDDLSLISVFKAKRR